jgi:nucleoside-diphosphate-sugar epimerase
MIIAVTGGSGLIGRKLVLKHLEVGNSVRVLTRSETSHIPDGAIRFVGDLTDSSFNSAEFLHDVVIVHNCAGELYDESRMHALHVDGTQRLLDAGLRESVRTGQKLHWVQLSSVGAYGPPQGCVTIDRTVTESTPTCPLGEYETTKTRADELVLQAGVSELITYSILRPSNVFGDSMVNRSLRGLIKMVKRGLFFYIGKPGAIATYVHVDDVVAAMMKCAFSPAARGQIYNLSADCRLEDLVNKMADLLYVHRPLLRIPEMPIRATVNILERWMDIPLSPSRIDALVKRTSYPADKLINELGFCFSKPMPDGIDCMMHEQS